MIFGLDERMKTIELVVFDMDGTLFKGANFWLDMHKSYGNMEEAFKYFQENKNRSYNDVFKEMSAFFWHNVDAALYLELVKNREYHETIKNLAKNLKQHGYKTALVSSGPYDLAARAQRELDIDFIRANRLKIAKNGCFTGDTEVQVDDANKYLAVLDIMNHLGLTNEAVATIGDSGNDIAIAERVALTFTINSSSDELSNIADYNLTSSDGRKILRTLNHRDKTLKIKDKSLRL